MFHALFYIISVINIGSLVGFFLLKLHKPSLAKSYGLGLGIITLITLLLGLLHLPLHRLTVMLLLLASYLPLLHVPFRHHVISGLPRLRPHPLLLWIGFLCLLTFATGIWGHDAYAFWLSKAHAFWLDHGITQTNLFVYWPYDQPLLWPIAASWLYQLLGATTERWVKIIPLTAYILLLVEFWQALRPGLARHAWTTVLALTPFLWGNLVLPEYAGNADLLVTFFVFLGLSALTVGKPILTALFLGFAVLTKNDIYPMLVGFIFLLPLFRPKHFLPTLLIALLFFLGSIGWKQYYHLSNRFLARNPVAILQQRPFVEYNRYTTNAFREELRQTYRWALGWWLILFVFATHVKALFRTKALLFAACLLAIQIAGLYYIYYVTVEDQASHITSSMFRVVLQLYPAALLLAYSLSSRTIPSKPRLKQR